jgi:hypothetical protein
MRVGLKGGEIEAWRSRSNVDRDDDNLLWLYCNKVSACGGAPGDHRNRASVLRPTLLGIAQRHWPFLAIGDR